jgi:hypothetical protein
MSNPEKKRIQLDFANESVERLDQLVSLTRAGSRAEVIRRALMLFDHIASAGDDAKVYIDYGTDGKERLKLF